MNWCCCFFFHCQVFVCFIPLWQLWRSNLLSWGINMTNHKVLGDLLHVLIIEEAVEAQLVCSAVTGGKEMGRGVRWENRRIWEERWGKRMEGWRADIILDMYPTHRRTHRWPSGQVIPSQKQKVHTTTLGTLNVYVFIHFKGEKGWYLVIWFLLWWLYCIIVFVVY